MEASFLSHCLQLGPEPPPGLGCIPDARRQLLCLCSLRENVLKLCQGLGLKSQEETHLLLYHNVAARLLYLPGPY